MSSLIGALRVVLGLDSAAFEQGATSVEKRAAKMTRTIEQQGKSFSNLGKTLSLAVTAPLAAFGYTAVKAAIESKDALAQVENTIRSMGNAAGRSAEQLSAIATTQMHASLYDDDEILRSLTNTLLTFGNVAGATFDRAQQAALDLSAKFGTHLQSSAMMVGKALNDPVKGITALTRAGISFTEQQKEQIKAMVAAGDVAGAQNLILGELEKQVAGSAAEAAKANPMIVLKHAFDDFQETVGGQLLALLPPITAAITGLLNAFGALPEPIQQGVVIAGVLAAAFGPLLTVLGTVITAMAPFLGALSVAFAEGGVVLAAKAAIVGLTAAFGPWLLAIGAAVAAGALIYQNWDKIGPALAEFGKAAQAALGPALTEMVKQVSALFTELWDGPLGEGIRVAGAAALDFYLAYSKAIGPVFLDLIKLAITVVSGFFAQITDGVRMINALLKGDWAGAWEAAASIVNRSFNGLPAYILGVLKQLVTGVQDWIGTRMNAIWQGVLDKIETVKKAFWGLYDAVVGHSYIPDMVDGIAAQMLRLDSVMVDKATKAAKATGDAFKALAAEVQPLLDRLFPEARALNDYRRDQGTINRAEKGGVLSAAQAEEARRRLIMEGRDGSSTSAIGVGLTNITPDLGKINDALDQVVGGLGNAADKAGVATVRIARSFADMANDTVSALQNMASSIKSGDFLSILGSAVKLFTQLASTGLFGKGLATKVNSVKAFANGTSFAPGGLALVGERGPELVNLPRGSQVYPNGTGPGGGNTYVIKGNLMTPEFWAMIEQGNMAAAQAGGEIGYRRVARSSARNVGF